MSCPVSQGRRLMWWASNLALPAPATQAAPSSTDRPDAPVCRSRQSSPASFEGVPSHLTDPEAADLPWLTSSLVFTATALGSSLHPGVTVEDCHQQPRPGVSAPFSP